MHVSPAGLANTGGDDLVTAACRTTIPGRFERSATPVALDNHL